MTLAARLAADRLLAPGVWDALSALLAERAALVAEVEVEGDAEAPRRKGGRKSA